MILTFKDLDEGMKFRSVYEEDDGTQLILDTFDYEKVPFSDAEQMNAIMYASGLTMGVLFGDDDLVLPIQV